MIRTRTEDLDYIATRLHGRYSRLAEGGRLDALCQLRAVPEFSRAIDPKADLSTVKALQRRLVQELIRELSGCLHHVTGVGADLLAWLLARFQVENLKVLLRGAATRTPWAALEEYLIALPPDLALNSPALAAAESLEHFAERLPAGILRQTLKQVLALLPDHPPPFFLEAALDRGYFQELLTRTDRLSGEDSEIILPLALHEAETFHLMLVARGRFHYGLTAESLRPLQVRWHGQFTERFNAMLGAPDMLTVAGLAVGRALDALPAERGSGEGAVAVEAAGLEAAAWKRFWRLSNRAFRRSHLGLGAVVGYVGLRRVEVANLITISEGIRTRTGAEAIRTRLIPRPDREAAHV